MIAVGSVKRASVENESTPAEKPVATFGSDETGGELVEEAYTLIR